MKRGKAFQVEEKFCKLFGCRPRVFRAPGRVNLIGEHTDYNEGFVLPAAIEFHIWVGIAPRADRKLRVYSENFSEQVEINLENRAPRPRKRWSDYVQGVALMLERAGNRLSGADLLVCGDVPIGAGLSSSAALEVATGLGLLEISGLPVRRVELAQLCRKAENEFVGARVGIMDQFISCCGRPGHALLLDCRSLDFRVYPLPPRVSLVICNTMVKHELASGGYNTRRAECEEGVRLLAARFLPGIRALRDVSLGELERHAKELPEMIFRRCRHVVTENVRVANAAAALEQDDQNSFGKLMAESHRSLRDDYEVSCAQLDLMVDLAQKAEGLCGARMTGGGFGGCTINLVEAGAVGDFQSRVASAYEKATGLTPQIFVSAAAEGAVEVME